MNQSELINVKNPEVLINLLFHMLHSKGISALDTRVAIMMDCYIKYSSFGFMPAIDHLAVLQDLMKKYNIDRSNIVALGSSYGGYIASLMGKYAPHTFSMIIDNSGFSLTSTQEVLGSAMNMLSGAFSREIDNRRYEIPYLAKSLWSLDETSTYYFSDAHKLIRNLIVENHKIASQTVYYMYHSVGDTIIPISYKDLHTVSA